MKKIVFFLLPLICNTVFAQWTRISSNDSTFTYTSMWFLNKDTGFVIGNNFWTLNFEMVVLRTMDGGNTWDTSFHDQIANIWSIQFVNDSVGYFGGQDGNTWKTSDMGNTWTYQNGCYLGGDYSSLFFVKRDTGFFHLFGGSIAKTDHMPLPGCVQVLYDTSTNDHPGTGSLRFLNLNDGYVAGGQGKFARTSDGGNTWQLHNGDSNIEVLCAWMSDTSHGVMAGSNGKVSVTNDGGNSWSTTDSISEYSLLDMSFINTMKGYAVGGTGMWWFLVPSNERRGLIWKTLDGGYTWTVDDSSFVDNIVSIFIVNDSLAYAAGNLGVILKNTNLFYDGVKEHTLSSKKIIVSPNPATNQLKIQNAQLRLKNITIYNVVGEKVYESENQKSEIDISKFLPGVYFLKLTGDTNTLMGKFIKE